MPSRIYLMLGSRGTVHSATVTRHRKQRLAESQGRLCDSYSVLYAFYRQGHLVDASTVTSVQLYVCAGRLDGSGGGWVGGLFGWVGRRYGGDESLR